jgi:N utilization substance protein B
MPLPRQKFREIVTQLLYAQSFEKIDPEDSIPFMMEELKVTRRSMLEAHAKVTQIFEHLPEIDRLIEEGSQMYTFERISRVEKTVLRLALYEFLHESDIPGKVVISEAIRLCRKFGTRESASFINAVLDPIYKRQVSGGTSSTPFENPDGALLC